MNKIEEPIGKQMKLLLVTYFNGIYPRTVFPIGLAYLASALRAEGHQADILDLSFYNNDPNVLSKTLTSYSPDIIGLSIRDVDSSGRDIFHHKPGENYLSDYKPFIDTCKKFIYPIVLGGAGFSIFPEEILKYFNLKLGIIGEGEHTFIKLVSQIQKNLALSNLPGLAYYENNNFCFNPPKRIRNLDNLHFPIRKILGNHSNLIGNIQTKRGCNQSCIYCSYPLVEGRRIRLRSPGLVVDEFEIMVKSLGYKYIFIVDSIFNNPIDHAYEICKERVLSASLRDIYSFPC
jgi:radical SAM superfamily enzyme YgiQ (UPF0313 family)